MNHASQPGEHGRHDEHEHGHHEHHGEHGDHDEHDEHGHHVAGTHLDDDADSPVEGLGSQSDGSGSPV
ncbi:MAG: hypothetical protein ACLGHD_04505, partial [Actinomycetes bacterium]